MIKRELELKEIQKYSYDILIDVTSFCDKNDIRYYLACGTLLGAIRHKGFIPWDDDVDIMMPRPDYNKFLSIYNGKYKIVKPSEGRWYYAKVYDSNTLKYEKGTDYKIFKPLGIDIDIFPLDGMINELELKKSYKRACFLEALLRLSKQPLFYKKNIINVLYRIITRIIGRKRIIKLIENNASKYSFDDSEYVVRMRYSENGSPSLLKKNVYEPSKIAIFENKEFKIPNNSEEWLNSFFGDYMILPPEEKRRSHGAKCYILEDENV